MTPQQKAKELVDRFTPHAYGVWDKNGSLQKRYHAIQCAKIAVDEIINTLNYDIRDLDVRGNVLLDLIHYWREVKQEIEKL